MTIKSLCGSSLLRNVFILFIVKFSGYIVPLAALPYLARVLGPGDFGSVAVAQSLSMLLSVIVEYGFVLSATREVSQFRSSPSKLKDIASRVLGAKIFLAVVALLLACLSSLCINSIRDLNFAIGAWLYAVAIGLSPGWYFQGVERLKFFSMVDIFGKFFGVALIFIFVKSSGEASMVLYLQSSGAVIGAFSGLAFLYRNVSFSWPNIKDCTCGLRFGFSMFIFRAAISLYTLANVFVLGLFVTPVEVAFFAGAEKLVRGVSGVIGPISQAVYPRVALLVNEDQRAAIMLVQRTFVVMFGGTIFIAAAVFIFSHKITGLVFGAGYEPMEKIMSSLVWILPLISIGNVLGIQWMLSLKMDKEFNFSVITAGFLNLVTSLIFTNYFGVTGMVVACVLSEAVVVLLITTILAKRKMLPLSVTNQRGC